MSNICNAQEYPVSNLFKLSQPMLSEVSPRDGHWMKYKKIAFEVANLLEQNSKPFFRTMTTITNPDRFLNWSQRINNCITTMQFKRTDDGLKLKFANFCRCRLCPVCASRRADIWQAKSFQVLPKLLTDYPADKYQFLFLTLTVKNCHIMELRETLAWMNKAFSLWSRSDRKTPHWPAIGHIKSTEVTQAKNMSAHPHFHVLLLVEKSYFESGNYIEHEQWCQTWAKFLKIDYKPVVGINSVLFDSPNDLKLAFIETLKYELKPTDFTGSWKWLGLYAEQVHKLRFISTGGILKDYFKFLEKPNEDLVHGADQNQFTYAKGYVTFNWDEKIKCHVADKI